MKSRENNSDNRDATSSDEPKATKQKPSRNFAVYPVKVTPGDINWDIYKDTKIPRISKKSIMMHNDEHSRERNSTGLKRYMSTNRISKVSFSSLNYDMQSSINSFLGH